VPLAKSPVKGELTTPTGAAILTAVVAEFVESPDLTIERIGHGSGTKDFIEQPNILRLLVGTKARALRPAGREVDTVQILETNLDDVPAEIVAYCSERLFAAGALDVFVILGLMKKGRPGVQIQVLCEPGKAAELESILFRETGTLGVRRTRAERSKLHREAVTIETPWGPVAAKRGWADGIETVSPEYEACAAVARRHDVPLRDVYEAVRSRAGRAG
jgi:uncharacterized protein (DUF111 family)